MSRPTLCLLLVVSLAGLSCFGHTTTPEPESPPRIPLASTQCGQTATGIVPVTWVRLDKIGSIDMPSIVAHESVHAAQMRRFPSCDDWLAWAIEHEAEAEAEAFCASATTDAGIGRATIEAAFAYYAQILAGGYPRIHLTPAAAELLIRSLCVPGGKP